MILVISSVIGGLTLVGVGYTVGVYNTINNATNDYEGQLADISAEYQRRLDLLTNLAKSVKSHKDFESKTYENIAKARAGLSEKPSVKNLKKVDSILAGLKVQIEAYPELKSSSLYSELNAEISETEDRVFRARAELNNIAEDYNTYIGNFPTVLIAKGLLHKNKLEYFKAEGKAKTGSFEIEI